jgi:DnaJ-class molecular chaperone
MTPSKNADGHTFKELYDAAANKQTEVEPVDSGGMIDCPECDGEGDLEYERAVPMSNSNPHGYYEDYWAECENCGGNGQIEPEEE